MLDAAALDSSRAIEEAIARIANDSAALDDPGAVKTADKAIATAVEKADKAVETADMNTPTKGIGSI